MKQPLKLRYLFFSLMACFWAAFGCRAEAQSVVFRHLGVRDGLSSSQVNCVYRDSRGFLWLGTASGLDRFDGFRFKNYYHTNAPDALPDNSVSDIQEDAEGNLWLHTSRGWCRFDTRTERFDSELTQWLSQRGISGAVECLCIDGQKNMWLTSYDRGCYYRSADGATLLHFPEGGVGNNVLPQGDVTDIATDGNCAVLIYNDGTIVEVDAQQKRMIRTDRYIPEHDPGQHHEAYSIFIDAYHQYWIGANNLTLVCDGRTRQWHGSVAAFLQSRGFSIAETHIWVKDVVSAPDGSVWVATDHDGLLRINPHTKQLTQWLNDKKDDSSLPDNTVNSLCMESDGSLWLGTYKNGMAYCTDSQTRFRTYDIGDVCTICEDGTGRWWCGTNDKGIVCFDPATGESRLYQQAQTHLGTDIVVSSLAARDGSLWFGTYNGGMAHYRDGQFQAFRAQEGGLANDNVWALAQTVEGNIIIGTLGAGVQILNPQTTQFTTLNQQNSKLPSDFISSLYLDSRGSVYVGHGSFYSVLDPVTRTLTNELTDNRGLPSLSPMVNQITVDSRQLVWLATASGAVMYDPQTGQLESVEQLHGNMGSVACSVAEGTDGSVWVVWDHAVAHVKVSKDANGKWQLFTTYYDELDGLQSRQFNYRALLVTSKGDVVIGGQDGISVMPAGAFAQTTPQAGVLFSGVLLFDHQLTAGEEYDGRVVFDEDVNESRQLRLSYADKAFTILLATNHPTVPEKSRFLYRLKGFADERWQLTPEGQPQVTYTNLSPGTYHLEVKLVYHDGTIADEVHTLTIIITPPFYLTPWAFLLYALAILAVAWLAYRYVTRRQQARHQMERMEAEAQQSKEIEEMKVDFFTNVSHELRTPLTLIISPLDNMIRKEDNPERKTALSLMYRNAQRLLAMVNQILDFNKLERQQPHLHLSNADIVAFIEDICQSFKWLAERKITLSFEPQVKSLTMSFDGDKLRKIMYNLLSNAYKFTPAGGIVAVAVRPLGTELVEISVADSGQGISDADKHLVFERFYQIHDSAHAQAGGSGVGLHLVKVFAELHGGSVAVADREGGGTVFTVTLPVGESLPDGKEMPKGHVGGYVEGQETRGVGHVEGHVDGQETRDMEQENTPESSNLNSQPSHLLVVDDSEDFLSFMVEILSDRYQVTTASDGLEALEAIRQNLPDVVLSDVMMPRMDGIELCRRVKADPVMAQIPFVMLTARLTDEQKIEGMEQGADDYITKPFNIDLLYLRIDNLLKWKSQSSAPAPAIPVEPAVKYVPAITEEKITSVDEQFVQKATAYVEQHLADTELTVEMMSEAMNMSRVNFYKRMLSLTGSTPSEFIRLIRMRHAARLLREGKYGVSEVAYRVGFNNPRYFSKYFRELYGVIPSQYKESPETLPDAEGTDS